MAQERKRDGGGVQKGEWVRFLAHGHFENLASLRWLPSNHSPVSLSNWSKGALLHFKLKGKIDWVEAKSCPKPTRCHLVN